MNDIISKYTPLTVEELKSELSFTYNVLAIFSVLFIVCLLIFILREVIFFKNNKKKLDLDKRDFNFFDFFQATVMGISLVAVLFSSFSYSNESEMLKKTQKGGIVRGWKDASLFEIEDKITIYNNTLRIEELPKNFKYKNRDLNGDFPKEFNISYTSNDNKKVTLSTSSSEDLNIEYEITVEDLNKLIEIQENRKKEVKN